MSYKYSYFLSWINSLVNWLYKIYSTHSVIFTPDIAYLHSCCAWTILFIYSHSLGLKFYELLVRFFLHFHGSNFHVIINFSRWGRLLLINMWKWLLPVKILLYKKTLKVVSGQYACIRLEGVKTTFKLIPTRRP